MNLTLALLFRENGDTEQKNDWLWGASSTFTRSYGVDYSNHTTDPTEDLDQVEGFVDSGGHSAYRNAPCPGGCDGLGP